MSDPADTSQLHDWLARIQAGDAGARDELVRGTCANLERLARKMLRRFPNVRRQAQTDDVLQNSLMRLLRSLEKVRPPTMRDFYQLAAGVMQRELLDLARHFARTNRLVLAALGQADTAGSAAGPEPADTRNDAADLERWEAFHEAWERLPVEERELVGLLFYHGWTHERVAELFGVSVRTVQRRWQAAQLKLHALMQRE
jgi:RNA polymerase sigma-70 factor (ECF subfamily)